MSLTLQRSAPDDLESSPGEASDQANRGVRPAVEALLNKHQIVLILVGLIGSGKSTFAEALQEHIPQIRRCNQDDLGDRRAVEALARQSLSEGLSICIDRTNFDASQRATWIRIAGEHPGTQAWVIVFDTPYEVCAARLQTRTDHPTIKSPEDGLHILARFQSQYQRPLPYEGYTRILHLTPADQRLVYSCADVHAILESVLVSPAVDPSTAPRPETSRGRGYWGGPPRGVRGAPYGGRGYYGRGRGYYGGNTTYGARGSSYSRGGSPVVERPLEDNWGAARGRSSSEGSNHGSWRSTT